jgi:hypothetical protein
MTRKTTTGAEDEDRSRLTGTTGLRRTSPTMSAHGDHDTAHSYGDYDGYDGYDGYDDYDRPISGRQVALIDLLDRLLSGGVVLTGDLVLSIADIDLVRVSLRAVIVAVREQMDEQWALSLPERTSPEPGRTSPEPERTHPAPERTPLEGGGTHDDPPV